MRLVFKDETFSFELLRTLGYAPYGGADIGECLKTAYRIKSGNFESWFREWHDTASRVYQLAEEGLARGQRVSAAEAYLRASNYFRTAEFFLHGNSKDARILETWEKSRGSFRKAMEVSNKPVEQVLIPYEQTFLPGYMFRPDHSRTPRPTLIVQGGFDSTGEELYFQVAAAAVQRQYNCFVFEGPGQGAVIREQRLPFRADWEEVVTPVIDYLLTRPEVRPHQLALMGISLGGYLAPRAAAFDHRMSALITNDGVFSYRFRDKASALPRLEAVYGRKISQAIMQQVMKYRPGIRWAIENGLYTFQVGSIWELMEATDGWSLEGVADHIQCPTLVCDAEADHFFEGQARMLYDALRCPKTFLRFTAEDGAEEHCHFGALLFFNHKVFDWLDSTLGTQSSEPRDEVRLP